MNPLDDAAQQEKTVERLMRDVHISKDKLDQQQQMQLFRVHQTQDLMDSLLACISQGRVPLLIRTPRCQLSKDDVLMQVTQLLALGDQHQVIDLRQLYQQAIDKPSIFKQEQKAEIKQKVKFAIEQSTLLVLNFDDSEPQVEEIIASVTKSVNSLNSTVTGQQKSNMAS